MCLRELCLEIEIKRQELFTIVSINGLDHEITLKISQELDQLLNKYNQILSNKLNQHSLRAELRR